MNSLAQAEFSPKWESSVTDVVEALAPSWNDSYGETVRGIPWTELRYAELPISRGFAGPAGSSDIRDIRSVADLVEASGDAALSALLPRCFLTAVHRQEWVDRTVGAPAVDFGLLDLDEILFRVRDLDNSILLVPDDRLEMPSLMLQFLSVPGRVDILKVRLGGGWTVAAAGSCNGASGTCEPGPPSGCCRWHSGQDGSQEGWVCRC